MKREGRRPVCATTTSSRGALWSLQGSMFMASAMLLSAQPVTRLQNMSAGKFGFAVGIALVSLATAFGQAPANDNFGDRTVVTGASATFGGTLVGATLEA